MKKNKSKLQGTPTQITYLKMAEGDEKRHRRRCVKYDKSTGKCNYLCYKCFGSSHCEYYEEKQEENSFSDERQQKQTQKMELPLSYIIPYQVIGVEVNHTKFGEGTIVELVENKTQIIVEFTRFGRKNLDIVTCINNEKISIKN